MREGLVEWCETERKTDRVAKSDLCRLPSSGHVRQQGTPRRAVRVVRYLISSAAEVQRRPRAPHVPWSRVV